MMLSAGRCQFIARDKSGGCFFSLSPSPSPEAGIGVTSIDTPRERAAVFTPTRRGIIFLVRFYNGRPKLGRIARADFLSRSNRNRPDLQSELR